MARLHKGKHPIRRPGLSSSTFTPPTLDSVHHAYPSTTYHLPTSLGFLATGPRTLVLRCPTQQPLSMRCQGSNSPLPEISTLIRVMACGSKPTRSSVRRRLGRQAGVSSATTVGLVGTFVLLSFCATEASLLVAIPQQSCEPHRAVWPTHGIHRVLLRTVRYEAKVVKGQTILLVSQLTLV